MTTYSPREAHRSNARRPRGVVQINGKHAVFESFVVEQKTHFAADTWRVEMPAWRLIDNGINFFADSIGTQVEVMIGGLTRSQNSYEAPTGLTSLIIGQVDNIDIDGTGGKLTISGRDFSAKLIDTKTANKWPDQTSSWIVAELAKEVGLSSQVTATTTPSGEYSDGYSRVSRSTPMWDTIKFLAEQEGFDTYVTGTTLYFGPPQADDDQNPLLVAIQRVKDGRVLSTGTHVTLHRSETIAGDLSVTVLSHSARRGKGVKAVATRAGKKVGGSSTFSRDSTQSYVIRRPGLTQEQAQQLANSMLADLTKHEKTANVRMEGEVTMNARRRVRLSGTNTSFDLDYYVSQITHRFSNQGGYAMEMNLKNHPTLSETTAS